MHVLENSKNLQDLMSFQSFLHVFFVFFLRLRMRSLYIKIQLFQLETQNALNVSFRVKSINYLLCNNLRKRVNCAIRKNKHQISSMHSVSFTDSVLLSKFKGNDSQTVCCWSYSRLPPPHRKCCEKSFCLKGL